MSTGSGNTLKMWIIAAGLALVVGVLLLVVQAAGRGNISYDRDDRALSCVHQDQCERPADHKPIAEFQNTVSNLGYLLFGICVLVRATREGLAARDRQAALTFGLGMCFLGLCSGYYHATLNFAGTRDDAGQLRAFVKDGALQCLPPGTQTPQILDMVGVYAVLLALAMIGIECALRKDVRAAGTGARVAAVLSGAIALLVVLAVFVVMAGEQAVGGKLAGAVLLACLALLGGLSAMRVLALDDHPVLQTIVWIATLPVWLFLSYQMKTRMHWDSTAVFAALAVVLAGLLGVNWALSRERVPWPELTLLGIVFVLGVVPRLFDGYDVNGIEVTRHDLCAPEGPLQPHAMWHLLSALALALSFDLLEKAGPATPASPGTLLLPQDGSLTAALEAPIGSQPLSAILVKVILSTASLLLLIFTIGFYNTGWPGVGGAATACALSVLLWLWPLF